ncbi:Ig-like domain repeat protein [Streptomyces sp. 4N124]|uniref:Ig-like domain repeat protein n=1 Tax=Streptomyces sp. 4N124 TaxID=3457420 RepID=UPI003FD30E8F
MAALAAIAAGLVALVASQSQPARAAESIGEFTFSATSGSLTDPEPFGASLTTPAACPDFNSIPINYMLDLSVFTPGSGVQPVLGSITNGSPFNAAKTVSLTKADNPDLVTQDLTKVFTADGTYELRLKCYDDFGGEHPAGNYWTQTVTVTGTKWVIGNGAEVTSTSLIAEPPVIEPDKTAKLTATVSPGNATGTVTFFEGATELGKAPAAEGKAELTTPTLAVGQHSFTARFTPENDTKFTASESEPFTVTVQSARQEIRDESGQLLTGTPELQRGQTVSVIVRGCEPGSTHSMTMKNNDSEFPDAKADGDGTVTWPKLTVPEDAVAGATAWDWDPDCLAPGAQGQINFTIPEPSGSPSGDPTDDPSGDPTDDPSGAPSDDPSGDPTDDPSGDTSGTTSGTTAGDSSGTGGDSGGTSPQGGLASTGSQIALFSGIGAIVLTAAGIAFVRYGRRNGLLNFGDPNA